VLRCSANAARGSEGNLDERAKASGDLELGLAERGQLLLVAAIDLRWVVETQWSVFSDPGKTGQVARARSQTVIT
jgi:hypothetical protein